MFFKKSNSAQEIEMSVFEGLPIPQSEEEGIEVALQSLAESAEIFEAMNLPDEAEVITQFMETIASGQFAMVKEAKKKAKKKSKTKTKKKLKKSPELSPDKQLDNLANIGWVFNAPSSDCGECNMDDDGSFKAELIDPPHQFESDEKNEHGFSLEDRIHNKENRGAHKEVEDKPLDYEKCKECGYDHAHEPEEAFNAHFPSKADEEFKNQFDLDTIDVKTADEKDHGEYIVNVGMRQKKFHSKSNAINYAYDVILGFYRRSELGQEVWVQHDKKDGRGPYPISKDLYDPFKE